MDEQDYTTQSSDELSQSIGQKVKGVAKAAGRKVARSASKTVISLIGKLIALAGPIGIGILVAAIVLGACFSWVYDLRGSTGDLSRDPEYSNPVTEVDGVFVAQALTEPQALIDAYYNYLSCISAQKLFVDPETGEEVWLQFDDTDETSDYAGLSSMDNGENQFYLPSYFIKLADELMHNGEFYYPEQIVKPVFSQVLPVKNSGDSQKYVTTLPLINDGSVNGKALYDNLYNGANNALYATEEPYTEQSDRKRNTEPQDGLDKALLAKSRVYTKETTTVSTETGEKTTDNVYTKQSDTVTDYGVWDYGFGSVIQYVPAKVDRYLDCVFESFKIHLHTIESVPVYDPETGEPELDPDTGLQIYENISVCYNETATIHINADDTAESLQRKINSYNTDTHEVVISPSTDQLKKMTSPDNAHITMDLLPIHQTLAITRYNNNTLDKYFGNAEPSYPIHIPVISAAATFSGSGRYEYDFHESNPIREPILESKGTFADDFSSNKDTLTYFSGTAYCGFSSDLSAVRSGDVCIVEPTLLSPAENKPTYGEPLGFQYLEEYMDNYKVFVPDIVRRDLDFTERVNTLQQGEYKDELDANKDGQLTIMDFILNLGLMIPYSGSSLETMGSGSGSAALSQDEAQIMTSLGLTPDEEGEVMLLAKMIGAEAGPNKLDQLMVGAVAVNRISDPRFPNTLVGVLSADNQYSTWKSGAIAAKVPSQQMISSARQVISGEFSIPANVVFQKVGAEGKVYMIVDNGPRLNTHTYSISVFDSDISSVDRFGREALSQEQARALADELNRKDAAAGYSTSSSSNTVSSTSSGTTSLPLEYTGDLPLYAVNKFNVARSVGNLRQVADTTQSVGALQKLINATLEFLQNIESQIKGLFSYLGDAFGGTEQPAYYSPFTNNIPLQTMYDTVIQAYTFTNQSTYSDEGDKIDVDSLTFLFFEPQDSDFSYTGIVLGNGSVFEGYTSPTTEKYQVTEPWSETNNGATLAVPAETIVGAVSDGTVTSVVRESNSRYTVEMAHSTETHSIRIVYGGLKSVSVSSGTHVTKNAAIGKVGSEGFFFSLYVDGKCEDPMMYFYQPVFTTTTAFMDVCGPDGNLDRNLVAQLSAAINAANNNITGVLDIWHQRPLNTKTVGECTWWAYGRAWQYCEQNGSLPTGGLAKGYGNGGDYYSLGSADFEVGSVPRAGSWIVWKRTNDPSGNFYGHVAFVEAVGADGKIVISESGRNLWDPHDGNGILVRIIDPATAYQRSYSLVGYVYLNQPKR